MPFLFADVGKERSSSRPSLGNTRETATECWVLGCVPRGLCHIPGLSTALSEGKRTRETLSRSWPRWTSISPLLVVFSPS